MKVWVWDSSYPNNHFVCFKVCSFYFHYRLNSCMEKTLINILRKWRVQQFAPLLRLYLQLCMYKARAFILLNFIYVKWNNFICCLSYKWCILCYLSSKISLGLIWKLLHIFQSPFKKSTHLRTCFFFFMASNFTEILYLCLPKQCRKVVIVEHDYTPRHTDYRYQLLGIFTFF